MEALLKVYNRNSMGVSYLAFRRTACMAYYDRVLMVPWSGMWLGIEVDGYTHS